MSRSLGFSLIELVIAIAILSVGLVGAMRVFPVGLRASHRSELGSRAAITAQRVVESMKLRPWEDLADGETDTEEDGFAVTIRVSPAQVGTVDASRLKRVEVQVRSTQTDRPRTVMVVTYLRRPAA